MEGGREGRGEGRREGGGSSISIFGRMTSLPLTHDVTSSDLDTGHAL